MSANIVNEKAFYDAIKKSHFSGKLGQKQFEGVDAILKEGVRRNLPLNHLAYILATPSVETGNTYQPIVEKGAKAYFNKYDIKYNPTKAKTLGNLEPGDGYKYRGRGHVQTTGRTNYAKFRTEVIKLFGVDILTNPDAILGNMALSAYLMFEGMIRGVYTGVKLSDKLTPKKSDYYNARRIVNGLDRAKELSDTAKKFEAALIAAGYQQDPNRTVEFDPMLDGMLYLGDRGLAVENYGSDLNYLGYGPATGDVYDPSYISATKRFQVKNGLADDGKAGPKTLAKVKQMVDELQSAEVARIKAAQVPVSTIGESYSNTRAPNDGVREDPYAINDAKVGKAPITVAVVAIIAGAVAFIEPAREWVVHVWHTIFG